MQNYQKRITSKAPQNKLWEQTSNRERTLRQQEASVLQCSVFTSQSNLTAKSFSPLPLPHPLTVRLFLLLLILIIILCIGLRFI